MTKLGILGGGQLAQMLALAAIPLDVRCTFLDPSVQACAGAAGKLIVGAYDDLDGLDRLAAASDVVTYEFESVPAASAARLEAGAVVRPGSAALEVAQDRLSEKRLFTRLGIETPGFWPIDSQWDLEGVPFPVVLKTRRLGYDGKGQRVLRAPGEAAGAFDALGGVPLIAEERIAFDRELSVVAVRGSDGTVACYPVVENRHEGGILRTTLAPAPGLDPQLTARAESYAQRLLEELDYVGVLALELFAAGDRLLANEIAPRVHNSGHWTIEGAVTSQFENHVRAVTGLPLGPTGPVAASAMINLIGGAPPTGALAGFTGAHLHLYGKAPRPGRKIGHVTLVGDRTLRQLDELEMLVADHAR
jgi:5-(carboxyamino)imidazole ribonucleotide synthase